MSDRLVEPVYIAGPMTGIEGKNIHAFNECERVLRALGIKDIENPASVEDGQDHPWEWYMAQALPMLVRCNSVVLLPGWQDSRGATMEEDLARKLNMVVVEWSKP